MEVICNTSPLVTLAKAGLLNLLPSVFQKIRIPLAVLQEIEAGPAEDPIKNQVHALSWLEVVTLEPPMTPLASWQLGVGESEVIEWARLRAGALALLDDALARKTAKLLGIQVCGTLGVLALARRKKIIPSFLESAHKLKQAGLFLKEDMILEVARSLEE